MSLKVTTVIIKNMNKLSVKLRWKNKSERIAKKT